MITAASVNEVNARDFRRLLLCSTAGVDPVAVRTVCGSMLAAGLRAGIRLYMLSLLGIWARGMAEDETALEFFDDNSMKVLADLREPIPDAARRFGGRFGPEAVEVCEREANTVLRDFFIAFCERRRADLFATIPADDPRRSDYLAALPADDPLRLVHSA